MTNLLDLPICTGTFAVGTNEDWRDAFALLDVDGNPYDFSGITFSLMVRPFLGSSDVLICASSDPGYNRGQQNGTIAVVGNVVAITVPADSKRLVLPSPDGKPYPFDILASDDTAGERVFLTATLTVVRGVATPPPEIPA